MITPPRPPFHFLPEVWLIMGELGRGGDAVVSAPVAKPLGVNDEEKLANAELIVRAVNAHQALVDAAKSMLEFLEHARSSEVDEHDINPLVKELTAALKLARGES